MMNVKMKRLLVLIVLSVLGLGSLTSCEDTNLSRVEITVSPEIPVIGDFEFDTGEDVVTPNWFGFTFYFKNPTVQRLIIYKISTSYRIGESDFTDPADLDYSEAQTNPYMLSVGAGEQGEEHEFISGVGSTINRYLYGLEADKKLPMNHNYILKFIVTGYFTNDLTSAVPLPAEGFEKIIYVRTKSAK